MLGIAAVAAIMFLPRGAGGQAIPIGDGRTISPDGTIRDASGTVIGKTSPTVYQQAAAVRRNAISTQPVSQDMSLSQMVTLGTQLTPIVTRTLSDVLRSIDTAEEQAAYDPTLLGEAGAELSTEIVPVEETAWWAPEDAWWADPNYVEPIAAPVDYWDDPTLTAEYFEPVYDPAADIASFEYEPIDYASWDYTYDVPPEPVYEYYY
jgi:hypothetical protein